MNGCLIDTNVIVRLLNGDMETLKLFQSLEGISISCITVGELMYGTLKSAKKAENDLWIAASAWKHRLSIVTYDKHFDSVNQLSRDFTEDTL